MTGRDLDHLPGDPKAQDTRPPPVAPGRGKRGEHAVREVLNQALAQFQNAQTGVVTMKNTFRLGSRAGEPRRLLPESVAWWIFLVLRSSRTASVRFPPRASLLRGQLLHKVPAGRNAPIATGARRYRS